jgi:hypothetical protein
VLTGLAVTLVLVLVGGAAALRAGDEDSARVVTGPNPGSGTPGEWTPMADGPLPPVDEPLAFTVGDEALIMGGGPGCPASASCGPPSWNGSTEAAAYDPTTDAWRSIAPLPHTLDDGFGAVIGDRLYLWGLYYCDVDEECANDQAETFAVYDVSDDAWTELTPPDLSINRNRDLQPGLATDGERIIAYGSIRSGDEHDVAYDPVSDTWLPLPLDSLRPASFRVIVPHDGDLYLFATLDSDLSRTQVAVLRAGAELWEQLPASPVLTGPFWYGIGWYPVGDLVVRPSPGPPDPNAPADPLEPYTGVFDTTSDTWATPPPSPTGALPYDTAVLGPVAGSRLIEVAGYVLDVTSGTWTPLPTTDEVADGGAAGTWVGDVIVVWGGYDPLVFDDGESDAGAFWTPPDG